MILSGIVAVAKNKVMGKNGGLPWQLPEEMKHFRERTKSSVMIMGRKTFDSLPGLLKGRFHIVISRHVKQTADDIETKTGQTVYAPEVPQRRTMAPFVAVVSSISAAVELADHLTDPTHPLFQSQYGEEVFVLGGAQIFESCVQHLDRFCLSSLHDSYDGDLLFPDLDLSGFKVAKETLHSGFTVIDYVRKSRV